MSYGVIAYLDILGGWSLVADEGLEQGQQV